MRTVVAVAAENSRASHLALALLQRSVYHSIKYLPRSRPMLMSCYTTLRMCPYVSVDGSMW